MERAYRTLYSMRSHQQHWHDPRLLCLHCHPHDYIRMVQQLIERCLLLRMRRNQCIHALAHHARIKPLVTLTVWRELLKENSGFFQAYFHSISPKPFYSRRIVGRKHYPTRFTRKRGQWW
ncbi:hypothetical protein V2J09_013108 [Rumex salicifolius]